MKSRNFHGKPLIILIAVFVAVVWTFNNFQPIDTVSAKDAVEVSSVFNCNKYTDTAKLESDFADSISKILAGGTLQISGTCNANLLVPAGVNDITLDGLGAAQLIGILNHPTNPDTIRIEGRGIIIKGFNITGGRDGIHVHFGGTSRQFNTAGIEGNTIQNTGRNGITVHANSTATIINNIITNNATGILVGENAVARIGKIYHGTGNPGTPNTIESNSHEGIVVLRSSNANIVGNFIRNNGRQGILVKGSSNAEVYDNQISGNLSQGIRVVGSSAVEISSNNVIENNGENGVYVVSGGQARIINNTIVSNGDPAGSGKDNSGVFIGGATNAYISANDISSNAKDGVLVASASHARVVDNFIDSNSRNGISVTKNSVLNLNLGGPNAGFNEGFGLFCNFGSAVDGLLGEELDGAGGKAYLSEDCPYNLLDYIPPTP